MSAASVNSATPLDMIGSVCRSCWSKKSMTPGVKVSLKRTLPICMSLILKNALHPDSAPPGGRRKGMNAHYSKRSGVSVAQK